MAVKKKKKQASPKKLKTSKAKTKFVDVEVIDESSANILPTEIASETGLVHADPLVRYMNEIKKYPLLTPEEEKELAIKYYDKKDPLAAEKLVTSNLRFVVKIALEYAKMGARLMDVIQEGNVGLMHAVKEYNPYKGVKLITYAVWWIRGYIQDFLLKQHSMVKIGTTQNQKKLYYNLAKEEKNLLDSGQNPKDAQLISARLGVREEDVKLMQQRLSSKDVSLDAPIDEDGQGHLLDFHASTSDPSSELEILELIDILRSRIDEIKPHLNEKELDILENRILADEPQTLQEIGDRYGISRERARQLEERLLSQIKNSFLEKTHEKVLNKIKT